MTKQEFGRLFQSALDAAALDTEAKLGRQLPHRFRIRLFGAGHSGDLLSPESALDALYLGEHRFYRVIDVGTIEVGDECLTIFVRASAHTPGSFEQTWNDPPGSGPFKQLGTAQDLEIALEQPVPSA
jgi:hypothetical protein